MGVPSEMRKNAVLAFMLAAISVAFGWILWPFAGAILWAVLLSITFSAWYRAMLARMPAWPNAAAGATVLLIAILVVLPLTLLASALFQEVSALIERFQSGELDLQRSLSQFRSSLPEWIGNRLTQFESTGLPAVQERLLAGLAQGWEVVARHALGLGQLTVDFLLGIFVMLYLLFHLLRDGDALLGHARRAIPLAPEQQKVLADTFTATVRGVLKGDLVVALVQGMLGGIIFWVVGVGSPLLWGALMAVLSLLPVLGAGLVWAPTAIYLLLTGSLWQGIVLLVFGTLVISTIDNILRPLLVGSDVKISSYVVLVSTLGGVAMFGVNGFVIGPLVASLFLATWEMYSEARGDRQDAASE